MVYFENAFGWSFIHHNLKNAWSKLQIGDLCWIMVMAPMTVMLKVGV
jgi:hypothetical protein